LNKENLIMQDKIYLISAVITLVTLVLAIFGSAWLNGRGTDKRIEELKASNADLLRELKASIDARFDAIEARFEAMEARFEAIEARFNTMEVRFVAVEQRLDRIERQLDAVFKPVLPPR
jgi:uncharacterized protein involved in exopolysaccharide biosynthesis